MWRQHQRYFRDKQHVADPDPLKLFDRDLVLALEAQLQAGDSIVLGIDQNSDTRQSPLSTLLLAIGLTEAILSTHKPASPPATHNRNLTRTPIDAIWISPAIRVSRAGYSPFDGPQSMKSDHRMLWVEIDNSSILGKHLPSPPIAHSSRVKSNDPRSRLKYNHQVKARYGKAAVFPKCRRLAAMVQKIAEGHTDLIPFVKKSYSDIHKTTTDIRLDVEKHLRKLRTGAVPYSPRLQRYRDTISCWERIVKLKKSVNTSRNQLKRLAKKLHIFTGFHVTLVFA